MIVPTRHRSRTRPRIGRGARRLSGPVPPLPPEPDSAAVAAVGHRERDAGGPEDRALYRCDCGCLFEAVVSTTVGCPHCGGAQAW